MGTHYTLTHHYENKATSSVYSDSHAPLGRFFHCRWWMEVAQTISTFPYAQSHQWMMIGLLSSMPNSLHPKRHYGVHVFRNRGIRDNALQFHVISLSTGISHHLKMNHWQCSQDHRMNPPGLFFDSGLSAQSPNHWLASVDSLAPSADHCDDAARGYMILFVPHGKIPHQSLLSSHARHACANVPFYAPFPASYNPSRRPLTNFLSQNPLQHADLP